MIDILEGQGGLEMIEFSALDRCDRCGAQAYSLARMDGLELMWCLHHRKKYSASLLNEGWEIIDDYEAIERLAGVPG